MEQEDNDDQGNDDGFLDQTAFQGVNGFANQTGTVIAGDDLDSRRQRSFDLSQLFFDAVDHVQGIQPVTHDDNAAHRLAFAVPLRNAFADIRTERNCAEVLEQDRSSVLRHHRHVCQIVERLQIAEAADHVSCAAEFEHATADFIGARLYPVNHGGQRDAVGQQLVGIEIDLVLAHEPADAGYFSHARNGL